MNGRRLSTAAVVIAGLCALLFPALAFEHVEAPSSGPQPLQSYIYPAPRPTVLFIGDSYTQGVGATSTVTSWARLTAEAKGWTEQNWARGGTGYAAVPTDSQASCGNPTCPNYSQMLRIEPVLKPRLVVVSGGRNDIDVSPGTVRQAITNFYAALRKKYPETKIVALSPIWDSRRPPRTINTIGAEVRGAAESVGGTYLNIGQPLQGHSDWIRPDRIHPNDLGHAAIARAVVETLRASNL